MNSEQKLRLFDKKFQTKYLLQEDKLENQIAEVTMDEIEKQGGLTDRIIKGLVESWAEALVRSDYMFHTITGFEDVDLEDFEFDVLFKEAEFKTVYEDDFDMEFVRDAIKAITTNTIDLNRFMDFTVEEDLGVETAIKVLAITLL